MIVSGYLFPLALLAACTLALVVWAPLLLALASDLLPRNHRRTEDAAKTTPSPNDPHPPNG